MGQERSVVIDVDKNALEEKQEKGCIMYVNRKVHQHTGRGNTYMEKKK